MPDFEILKAADGSLIGGLSAPNFSDVIYGKTCQRSKQRLQRQQCKSKHYKNNSKLFNTVNDCGYYLLNNSENRKEEQV